MSVDLAAIKPRISELTSGTPPLTGEDTIICWMTRLIQPLQHRTSKKTEPMQISKEDLSESQFEARFNKLIKARPNEGR